MNTPEGLKIIAGIKEFLEGEGRFSRVKMDLLMKGKKVDASGNNPNKNIRSDRNIRAIYHPLSGIGGYIDIYYSCSVWSAYLHIDCPHEGNLHNIKSDDFSPVLLKKLFEVEDTILEAEERKKTIAEKIDKETDAKVAELLTF